MGKLNLNLDEFEVLEGGGAVVEGTKAVGGITTPIANAVKETQVAKYNANRDIVKESQKTFQIKYDVISNVVGDACGVINNIINAVKEIGVEKERTKQVNVKAAAAVHMAKEQTKQIITQEKEATKRYREDTIRELGRTKSELKAKLADLAQAKEKMLADEKKFNSSLESIRSIIDSIIQANKKLQDESVSFDIIHSNNEQLIQLTQQIVNLYGESKRGA